MSALGLHLELLRRKDLQRLHTVEERLVFGAWALRKSTMKWLVVVHPMQFQHCVVVDVVKHIRLLLL